MVSTLTLTIGTELVKLGVIEGVKVSVGVREAVCEGVSEAVVFGRPVRASRHHEILALVQTSLEAAVIRREIQADLSPWALPRVIRVTDRIPMAATGKYDRRAIAAFFASGKKDPQSED